MVTYINNLIETDKLQNDDIDKLKRNYRVYKIGLIILIQATQRAL